MSRRANTHRTRRNSTVKTQRNTTHRTIDAGRKMSGRDMYTIDVSRVMTGYNTPFLAQQSNATARKFSIEDKKFIKEDRRLPSLKPDGHGLSP